MSPVKRYFFNLLAVLSLLLGVATAGMWVRSWYQYDRIRRAVVIRITDGPAGWDVDSTRSHVSLVQHYQGPQPPRPTTLPKGQVWVGVQFVRVYLEMPHWLLVTTFGIVPIWWINSTIRLNRRKKRQAAGL